MFDLNDSIRCWKSAFEQHEGCSTDDVQELESHLREEVAALERSGLSEQEAFMVGVSRLGNPGEVCNEYAKANPGRLWQNRMYWMAVGVLLCLLVPVSQRTLPMLAAGTVMSLGVHEQWMLETTAIAVRLLSLSAFAWCTWVCYSRGLPKVAVAKLATITTTRTRMFAFLLVLLITKFLSFMASGWIHRCLRQAGDLDIGALFLASYGGQNAALALAIKLALPIFLIVFVVSQTSRRYESVPTTR